MRKIKEKYIKIEEAKNLLKPASDYLIKDDKTTDEKSKKVKSSKKDLSLKVKKEVKPKIVIKAYNPDLNKGLSDSEIENRKKSRTY